MLFALSAARNAAYASSAVTGVFEMQRDLPARDVVREHEVPARPAARLLEDVDDVRLVEREQEPALHRRRTRRPRVTEALPPPAGAAGRRARRGAGAGAARGRAGVVAGSAGVAGRADRRGLAGRRRGRRGAAARGGCGWSAGAPARGSAGSATAARTRRGGDCASASEGQEQRAARSVAHGCAFEPCAHGPLMLYSLRIDLAVRARARS